MNAPRRPGAIRWSVAMCTFNGERFLGEQLASLLDQSQLPDELVVVDDASHDGTLQILEEFASRAPFAVRVIPLSENVGSTLAFERAVSETTGDLVALCDQDDLWLPSKLAVMGAHFDADTRVGLVFSDAEIVDEAGAKRGWTAWQTEQVHFAGEARARFVGADAFDALLRDNYVTGAACAFRGVYRELVLPFSVLDRGDRRPWRIHDAWIALLIASAATVVAEDTPLSHYRVHSGQQIGLARSLELRGMKKVAAEVRARKDMLRERRAGLTLVENRLLAASAFPRPASLIRVADELAHLDVRLGLPRSPIARARVVAREASRGGYGRYSMGAAGISRDLVGI